MLILTCNKYQCSILSNLHLPKLAPQSQLAAFVICKPKVLLQSCIAKAWLNKTITSFTMVLPSQKY